MHFGLTHDNKLKADIDVDYSAITFFSEDKRYTYIYLKIAPSCLNEIGSGKGTYLMWNGGLFLFLIWNLVNNVFWEDQESGLQLLP